MDSVLARLLDENSNSCIRRQLNKSANFVSHQTQARSVFTRDYHFVQLENSPHARTAGRALYHGCWARPESAVHEIAGGNDNGSQDEDSPHHEDDRAHDLQGSDYDGDEFRDADEVGGDGDFGNLREQGGTSGGDKGTESENAGVEGKRRRRIAWPPSWPPSASRGKKRGKKKGVAVGRGCKRADKRGKAAGAWWKKAESVPHGEGYAEFLDGWGVSQVSTCVLRRNT